MGGFDVLNTPILAQMDPGAGGPSLVVLFVLLAVVTIGVPVWLILRQAARERDLEHTERMKALELGRPLRGDAPWWTPAQVAVAIGAGVPVGVFGIVWLAALTTDTDGSFAWPSAAAVGLAAVICGTVLAVNMPQAAQAPPPPAAKPAFDPDAYDIAGHHG